MSVLYDDDLVGQILQKVSDGDRKSLCKQWYKVESLRRSSLTVSLWYLNRCNVSLSGALTRFPNLVNLKIRGLKNDTDLELIARTYPKLESIVVYCNMYDGSNDVALGPKCLLALGNGCPKLSRVTFVGSVAIGDTGVVALLHSAHNLKAVSFVNTRLISGEALRAIASSSSISMLNLTYCDMITDVGLSFLANGSISQTIKNLNLSSCSGITDTGVELLCRMQSLECLQLSFCGGGITDIGGVAISKIQTLKVLQLFCFGVSDTTIFSLAENCRNLEILDLSGCVRITGAVIRAFSGHKCLKRLILLGLVSNFNLADVEALALGCPSLESESVLVDSRWSLGPTWSS